MLAAVLLAAGAGASAYPGKAPWRDAKDVFADGEPVPGLPHPQYVYIQTYTPSMFLHPVQVEFTCLTTVPYVINFAPRNAVYAVSTAGQG
jgi:hypothetical protein